MIVPSIQLPTMTPHLEDHEDLGPFVYFIRWGEYMKIGTSINPARRLDQIFRFTSGTIGPPGQIGYPELVASIPGNARDERNLHRRFAAHRTTGEWFLLSDELREAAFEAASQQMGIELKLAGENPSAEVAGEIYMRRLPLLDRLEDEDYADLFDSGELDEA